MSGDADAHGYLNAVRECDDGPRKRFILSCLTAATGQVGDAHAQLEGLVKDLQFPGDHGVLGPAASSLAAEVHPQWVTLLVLLIVIALGDQAPVLVSPLFCPMMMPRSVHDWPFALVAAPIQF